LVKELEIGCLLSYFNRHDQTTSTCYKGTYSELIIAHGPDIGVDQQQVN